LKIIIVSFDNSNFVYFSLKLFVITVIDMPNRVRLHEPEPVEDLAIDNLLEIDLEEKEPISWEEKV